MLTMLPQPIQETKYEPGRGKDQRKEVEEEEFVNKRWWEGWRKKSAEKRLL